MMARPSAMAAAKRWRRSTKGAGSNGLIGAIIQRRRGSIHSRWNGGGLPEPRQGAHGSRGLLQRAPARRPRRAARLRIDLGRRAPLHRLHDVPGCAPVPHVHGGPHRARAPGLDGRGPAVARPDARGRGSLDARQHLGRPAHPGPRPRGRQGGVRRLSPADGRVAPALHRIGRDAAARARDGLLRVRGDVRQAAARRDTARAVQDLPRPHLCGGRLTGVAAGHGQARRRNLDHPQKPWKEVARELETYRTIYREVNAVEAPPPVSAGWTFCDESAARAQEMARRFIGGYYQTVLEHYQFQGDHLARTKCYEYYGKMAEKITQYGTDTVIDYFMNLQVWGTPEQCYEKILDIHARTGNSHYVGVFSYAGMPYEDAERNMRLFAREVMPALKKLGVDKPAAERVPAASRTGEPRDVGLLGS